MEALIHIPLGIADAGDQGAPFCVDWEMQTTCKRLYGFGIDIATIGTLLHYQKKIPTLSKWAAYYH